MTELLEANNHYQQEARDLRAQLAALNAASGLVCETIKGIGAQVLETQKTQKERIAELEAALEPFAHVAGEISSKTPDEDMLWPGHVRMPTVGSLRAAAAVMGKPVKAAATTNRSARAVRRLRQHV